MQGTNKPWRVWWPVHSRSHLSNLLIRGRLIQILHGARIHLWVSYPVYAHGQSRLAAPECMHCHTNKIGCGHPMRYSFDWHHHASGKVVVPRKLGCSAHTMHVNNWRLDRYWTIGIFCEAFFLDFQVLLKLWDTDYTLFFATCTKL